MAWRGVRRRKYDGSELVPLPYKGSMVSPERGREQPADPVYLSFHQPRSSIVSGHQIVIFPPLYLPCKKDSFWRQHTNDPAYPKMIPAPLTVELTP